MVPIGVKVPSEDRPSPQALIGGKWVDVAETANIFGEPWAKLHDGKKVQVEAIRTTSVKNDFNAFIEYRVGARPDFAHSESELKDWETALGLVSKILDSPLSKQMSNKDSKGNTLDEESHVGVINGSIFNSLKNLKEGLELGIKAYKYLKENEIPYEKVKMNTDRSARKPRGEGESPKPKKK
jgi:hypothetical protein